MKVARWPLAAWAAAGWLCACQDDPVADATDSGVADAVVDSGASLPSVPTPDLDVRWEPCPARTGRGGRDAECATVDVPADHMDPDGASIELFVKRIAGESGSDAQLWMLMGGPGGSSALFEPELDRYRGRSDVDLMLVDHRGVGRSTRLSCPEQESDGSELGARIAPSEVSGCTNTLSATHALELFTTTQAAWDLAALINATREPDKEVFVYGLSYGTYWLNRYLLTGAAPVDGLIFDSVCAPGSCRAGAGFDLSHDVIGRAVLEACRGDSACTARLPDPADVLAELLDRIDGGHCSNLWSAVPDWEPPTRESVTRLLGTLLQSPRTRGFVPAVIHRLSRCESADRAALVELAMSYSELTLPQEALDLNAFHTLGNHISFSELWRDVTAAEQTQLDQALFTGGGLTFARDLADLWPTYDEPLRDQVGATQVPVLVLMGDLDPQTPPEVGQPLVDAFTGPAQTTVLIERGAHNLVVNSPLGGTEETCGSQLLEQFLRNPRGELDTSCTSMTLPLVFDGQPALSQDLLGTMDRWD